MRIQRRSKKIENALKNLELFSFFHVYCEFLVHEMWKSRQMLVCHQIVQFILAGKKRFLFLNVNVSRNSKDVGPRNRLFIQVIGPK